MGVGAKQSRQHKRLFRVYRAYVAERCIGPADAALIDGAVRPGTLDVLHSPNASHTACVGGGGGGIAGGGVGSMSCTMSFVGPDFVGGVPSCGAVCREERTDWRGGCVGKGGFHTSWLGARVFATGDPRPTTTGALSRGPSDTTHWPLPVPQEAAFDACPDPRHEVASYLIVVRLLLRVVNGRGEEILFAVVPVLASDPVPSLVVDVNRHRLEINLSVSRHIIHYIPGYCTGQCTVPHHTTLQNGTAQHSTAQHSTAQHSRSYACTSMRSERGYSGNSWSKDGRQGGDDQVFPAPPPSARIPTLTHGAHTTHTAPPVYLYPWVDIPAIAFW